MAESWMRTKLARTIVIGVVAGAIVLVVALVVLRPNGATRQLRALPEGSLQVVNADGSETTLQVRIGGSDARLSDVQQSEIEEVILYSAGA